VSTSATGDGLSEALQPLISRLATVRTISKHTRPERGMPPSTAL
jgi:hypothetical protein